jgi:[ribosomal protein S5]-alanine N-acetyltransferase
MSPGPAPSIQLNTARLVLRPTCAADAERAVEIQSDWDVMPMLRMAAAGSAYRFAVSRERRLIGIVNVDEVDCGEADLGYWFDKAVWGLGYATEAARAIGKVAFDDICISQLRAGHASDNVASARVLQKLGFQPIDKTQAWSRSRGAAIIQCRYLLTQSLRGRTG